MFTCIFRWIHVYDVFVHMYVSTYMLYADYLSICRLWTSVRCITSYAVRQQRVKINIVSFFEQGSGIVNPNRNKKWRLDHRSFACAKTTNEQPQS